MIKLYTGIGPVVKKDGSPTVHRDGTVSFLNSRHGVWIRRPAENFSAGDLARFTPKDRNRIARLAEKHAE